MKTYRLIVIFSLFSLYFLLGLSRVSSTIPSILLSIFGLILAFQEKTNIKKVFKNNTFLILTTIYFFFTLISFFQEEHILDYIEKEKLKVFFLLIPLVFFLLKKYIIQYSVQLQKASLIGNFVAIAFFLIVAALKYPKLGSNSFLYSELVSVSAISVIVYTFYLNINVIILFYSGIVQNKLYKHILIIIQGLFIFLTISKIGIIIFIFSYFIFLFIEIKRNFKFGFSLLLVILFFSTTAVFLGLKTPNVQRRVNNFHSNFIQLQNKQFDKSFPRLAIIKYSKNILKGNMIFGVGISNVREKLREEFIKNNYKKGISYNLDAHNLYIQTLLGMGVLGLISMLSMFIFIFYIALKNRNWFLLHFIIIISLSSFIESLFESQMGVFIFLLYSLLLIIQNEEEIRLKNQIL